MRSILTSSQSHGAATEPRPHIHGVFKRPHRQRSKMTREVIARTPPPAYLFPNQRCQRPDQVAPAPPFSARRRRLDEQLFSSSFISVKRLFSEPPGRFSPDRRRRQLLGEADRPRQPVLFRTSPPFNARRWRDDLQPTGPRPSGRRSHLERPSPPLSARPARGGDLRIAAPGVNRLFRDRCASPKAWASATGGLRRGARPSLRISRRSRS